ncbi:MAG: hypothetical protein P4L96_16215 [Rhodoferax sp.]|nr:hypothetical protein [Rhodoferax sp.]
MTVKHIEAIEGGSLEGASAQDRAASSLPCGRFAGRSEFAQLVRDALACAAREGWREIIVSDATFEDWPLGERALAEPLQAWARAGRKFTMLAQRYDEVSRRHARFVTWRRTWAHIVECRRCVVADPLDLPSAIWSPVWALRRLDLERSTGVCGNEPERRLQIKESLDEWLRKSTSGFPASTLGL